MTRNAKQEVAKDAQLLEKLRGLCEGVGRYTGWSPSILAAIISHESRAGKALGRNGCPPGTGDSGHGRGLGQVDDRWHKKFLAVELGNVGAFWRYAPGMIAYMAFLLDDNMVVAKRWFPGKSKAFKQSAALAGYNCGMGSVKRAVKNGDHVDKPTTPGNYSQDILERAQWLREKKGWA